LTGYHRRDVTFNLFLGGYMTTAAYAAIYVIWGSTYLAISLAVDSIPPLLMMGLRCSAAGVLLLAWAALRGERAEARHWAHGRARRTIASTRMWSTC
jgi:drug/metabolite transporter (DMT)-like permease